MESQEIFEIDQKPTIKGFPELRWTGKTQSRVMPDYPAQPKEQYGEPKAFGPDGKDWINKIYWGDNLQVMSHLRKEYRGSIDLIYIDPPFQSGQDFTKTIKLRGEKVSSDGSSFEEKQYKDIWSNDEYLQFMYERIVMLRELLN